MLNKYICGPLIHIIKYKIIFKIKQRKNEWIKLFNDIS